MDSISKFAGSLLQKRDNGTDVVVMEYRGHGQAIVMEKPYNNSYVSIVHIKDRKIFLRRDYVDQSITIDAVGGMEPLIKLLGSNKLEGGPLTCRVDSGELCPVNSCSSNKLSGSLIL